MQSGPQTRTIASVTRITISGIFICIYRFISACRPNSLAQIHDEIRPLSNFVGSTSPVLFIVVNLKFLARVSTDTLKCC